MLTFGLFLLGAIAIQVNAQAKIEFEKMVHDYGTIEQNGNGACEFKFTNNGSEPLVISNARGSCGCTVPSWPKEPIAPGESAMIKVKYDTKRLGPINKQVTITSNGSEAPVILRIKGKVEAGAAAPEGDAAGPRS